jgi:FkbM family methyltransferase
MNLKKLFLKTWLFVCSRKSMKRFNQILVRLGNRGLGIGNCENEHWSGEVDFYTRYLSGRTAPMIFDVGANIGRNVEIILGLCPSAQIHAFEPHPKSFTQLAEHAKGRFYAHPLALGEKPTQLKLYDSPGESELATFHPLTKSGEKAYDTFDVSCETIDHFRATHNITKIDLLKIDVEGHELSVLRGARETLAANAIDTIQFEFNDMNVRSRVMMADFRDLLKNFRLYRLLPHGMIELPRDGFWSEVFCFQNIVAYRE